MRGLARWAVRLYPAAWRARYGREFEVLLEDIGPGWRDLRNVVWGALKMQISSLSFGKATAALAIAGALVAGFVGVSMRNVYQSTAVAVLTPVWTPQMDRREANLAMAGRLERLRVGALSRPALADIINRLGLYQKLRERYTLEDAVAQMQKDVRILPIDGDQTGERHYAMAFLLRFEYPDRFQAQRVTAELMSRLMAAQVQDGRVATASLEVLDPASLPPAPSSPNRWAILFVGVTLGVFSAIAFFGARHWPIAGVCAETGALAGALLAIVTRTHNPWPIVIFGLVCGVLASPAAVLIHRRLTRLGH
ncbi:MAG: hypothetical protein LAQ30_04740 [Acidobacteriia bacterium]|nr:hypothetical protein [Terriglobia bacterium]